MTEQALFLDVFSEKDQHLNVVEKPMTGIFEKIAQNFLPNSELKLETS